MYLNEYYQTLRQCVSAFENNENNKTLIQQAATKDLDTYTKYKNAMNQIAQYGIDASGPDTTKWTAKTNLDAAKKLATDTFGSNEYPENLKDESALIKALILQVWVEHKERFAHVELDSVTAAIAYSLTWFGYESVAQRQEVTARQAQEMREILGVSAPTLSAKNSVETITPAPTVNM